MRWIMVTGGSREVKGLMIILLYIITYSYVCVNVWACACLFGPTVNEVKVRHIPPKPLKETAIKMRGDNTEIWIDETVISFKWKIKKFKLLSC